MIDGSVTNDINGSQPTREIDWVKSPSMSNNNLDIDGSIVEEIDSSQIFKGGIDIPNGWKVQYSIDPNGTPSDQRVFNDYDLSDQQLNPLTSIRYLKFTTTTASGFKPYTSTEVKPYQEVALTKAAPDAKQLSSPILFNDKIYSIVRAARASQADSYHLECFDTRQNQRCVSDITFPAYFSSQDATFASPTKLNTGIKDINTSRYFEPVLDDGTYGHPGRVYIPAGNSSNNYGIYCVDLSTHENCGYTSMGTTTKAVSATANNPTLITGFVQKDGKIYGHANDWDTVSQTMICFDITTGSQCPGYSSSTVAQVRTMFSTEHADKYETSGIHAIYGDNMYWVVPYLHGNINHSAFFWDAEIDAKTQRHRGYVLACYNIINRTNCGPDFTAISPRYFSGDGIGSSTTYGFVGDIQIANNPGSGEPEVCMIFNSVIFASHAYDTRILCKGIGSVKSTANTVRNTIHRPANFQGVTIIRPPTSTPDNEATQAWRIGGKGITITDKEGHVKTYSPWHYGPHASMGMTSCYDWTTDESCANFPYFKSWTGVNNYGNGDMGYVYDGVCIIGLGAQGYIWSFNPGDGTTPCRSKRETFSATIQKEDFYCDGASRSIGWGILKLSKANPYDFKNLPVKVYTSAGGTLLGEVDIREDGYMDLSDSIYQVYDTLHVEVEPQFHNKSPWSNGSIPLITASATGDNIQFCYKTELKTYADGLKCNIQQSRTNSELSFENNTKDLYAHATAEIDITQDPEKQCFKDLKAGLTLNKSQVGYAETFEVKANIENKANTDPLGLGNIPSIEDTDLMTIDITIPNGITVISTSPSGGIYSSGKVRWSNQSIDARTSKEYIVEAKTPDTSAFFNNSTHSQGKVYAATTQENIPFQVQVSYQNDIYQNDNSANNTLVFNKISSPEPNNPINPANPPAPSESNQPTPSNPSSAPAPTTAEPTEPNDNDEDNLNDGQDTNQNQANDQETRNNDSSVNNNRSTRRSTSEPRPEPARTYTPAVINAVLPGTLEQPAERIFSTIGRSVASIPQGVARSIPFGIISFLAILALVYVFEAYKEINTRRIASKIITKLKRNETMTNEFIQIISHHLTTPIATIAGAVELLQNKNELTSDVLGEMSQSINTLQGHSSAILNYSFSQAPSNKSAPMISFA
ncbi:hypothetical protein KC867_01985, partial [Candidatus Saccharibacteria bacterium]|nr:hypothetical protein [Candidatus Saccharibacteria bacterium]